jgi:nucleotide-binding universal stress UspA family protein
MYKNITVGYDGTDRALLAVEEASDLAAGLDATLHIVTAVPKDEVHRFGTGSDELWMSDVEIARDQLVNLTSKVDHDNITVAAVVGAPASAVVKEAERVNADVIVVGNKNVQGISRILGSVAEDVAQKAPCAVLIAKTA